MRRILLLSFSLMLSIFASAQDIQTFVQKQMETYPKSRLLDIYKSCFQDYMGAEHLVSDRQRVKAYLDEELQSTSLDSLMTWLYEPCGVDGRYVRVSIRAIKEGLIKEDMLLDAAKNDSMSLFGKSIVVNVDKWVDDFDTMKVGNMELLFLYTPGHTKGGMCILTEGHLFSGDTLFRYSIGRTDFYGGSWPQLEKSIKNKLYTLPYDTVVLPGHMGFTTIGDEKKGNPFVR